MQLRRHLQHMFPVDRRPSSPESGCRDDVGRMVSVSGGLLGSSLIKSYSAMTFKGLSGCANATWVAKTCIQDTNDNPLPGITLLVNRWQVDSLQLIIGRAIKTSRSQG